MSDLLQDLRYSVRLLLKTPGFSLTAILVLALGIGANAAIFSLVNALLLKPLAGSERPGEVVGIYAQDRTRPNSYKAFSYPAYTDIRDRGTSFSQVMGFTLAFVGLGEGEATRRTFGSVVTGNYFSTLGVDLLAGRTFTAEEERPGSLATVTVVSHQYWKAHGGDLSMLGQAIRINARPFTVVGIAPPGFTGTSVVVSPEVWVPTGAADLVLNDFMRESGPRSIDDRRSEALMVVGRLKPGVSEAAAEPALRALSAQLEEAYPAENKNLLLTAHRLPRVGISTNPQDDGDMRSMFVMLMAMAATVLLVASLNLANMMLARGTARRKEIAMRLALGGGRGRIVRQLLTEGLTLSLLGGAGGLVLGTWGVHLLVATLLPLSPVPLSFDGSLDARVLAATLAFCVFSTLVFGLGPAWRLSRTSVVTELKEQSGEDPARGRARWFSARNVLVASQIALSLGLLTAAGLFTRGALKASRADPGYRLDRQIVASIDTSLAGYDEARGRQMYRRLMERLRSMPGIQSASLASVVAFGDITEGKTVQKGGTPPGPGKDGRPVGVPAVYYIVGADYFKTLGVPVLRGRGFTAAEEQDRAGPAVAVIDEPLARALFPGEDALGQQIQLPRKEDAVPASGNGIVMDEQGDTVDSMEIVGIVPGLRHELFDKAPVAHLYVPSGRQFRSWMNVHLRTAGGGPRSEGAVLQAVRQQIREVDERLPVLGLKTMTQHRDSSILYWVVRAGAGLFMVFGGVAVFMAVVGLYAVKAYVVARRTREIGIRMALGSTPGGVMWLVLKEGLWLTAAGLGAGFLIAIGIGIAVGSMLYEVRAFDPLVFAAAPLLLAGAALAACYLPARRATKISPTVALRTE
jgi:predicted permease